MKQQLVVTHRYSFTGDGKPGEILDRPTLKNVRFFLIYTEKQFFCGYRILAENVFVTRLSSNAGISV
jgi:hypothetical protein